MILSTLNTALFLTHNVNIPLFLICKIYDVTFRKISSRKRENNKTYIIMYIRDVIYFFRDSLYSVAIHFIAVLRRS